ncbi:MAG: hypothetical protein FJ405_07560 [Verrucomicrobia bacterium]|nr:hypothetical protein [Verrucomicrobiota bacterium]
MYSNRCIGMILVWVILALRGLGQDSDLCGSCSQKIGGRAYQVHDRIRSRQVIICDRCAVLPTRCDTCQLPVAQDYTRLSDQRLLCPLDFREAVLDLRVALEIFGEVKRDLFAILSGLGYLPDQRIELRLVDRKELGRIFAGTPGAHPDSSLQGVTRTRRLGKDSFEHQIFLCLGLSRSRIAAVSAHEYAHAWIHENKPMDRVLDRDTEEAFCELTALHLMRQRGEEREVRAIRENAYTRGKIDVLVKTSDNYQFHRVAEWVKSGVDATLEDDGTHRVAMMRDTPVPLFGYLPQVKAREFSGLRLQGLSGTGGKRFAMVNGATLQEGERAKLRVAGTNLWVTCREIRSNAVVIVTGDAMEVQVLELQ